MVAWILLFAVYLFGLNGLMQKVAMFALTAGALSYLLIPPGV